MKVRTKVLEVLARDLLFADDCALAAYNESHLQDLPNCLAEAAKTFGLTIGLQKTYVLLRIVPGLLSSEPSTIETEGAKLNSVNALPISAGVASLQHICAAWIERYKIGVYVAVVPNSLPMAARYGHPPSSESSPTTGRLVTWSERTNPDYQTSEVIFFSELASDIRNTCGVI